MSAGKRHGDVCLPEDLPRLWQQQGAQWQHLYAAALAALQGSVDDSAAGRPAQHDGSAAGDELLLTLPASPHAAVSPGLGHGKIALSVVPRVDSPAECGHGYNALGTTPRVGSPAARGVRRLHAPELTAEVSMHVCTPCDTPTR